MGFITKMTLAMVVLSLFQKETKGQSASTATLTRNLLALSDPEVRPNADRTGPEITVNLFVTGAEKAGRPNVVTVGFWVQMLWIDPRLSWDPAQYNNITTVYLPARKLWLPNFAVWHSANPLEPFFSEEQRIAVVTSNGAVAWSPKGVITVYADQVTPGNYTSGATYQTQSIIGDWDLQDVEISVKAVGTTVDLSQQKNSGLQVTGTSLRSVIQSFEGFGRYPLLEVILNLQEQTRSA
ncbi:hypothetical protein RvY_06797 [Ramazzottius varieornatus]|uniref:Neurotransmitter-gated ion-channel ligand-binding domain-containing protein n=1 Tax=Ramazzottius varieornatus TaxID=947166 RepID=A0A1D1V545_RAMVA|nr:hypothetical protein RvY_06797 [Ramazzottius varieornatus]